MTYDGKNVANTNTNGLVGVPGQTSYYQITTALITSTAATGQKHYSYIAGKYVYLLEGNTSGSGGFSIFRAPLTDPTNIIKTGNVALYASATTHFNTTLLMVGNYIYMYGGSMGATSIYRAPLSNPEAWSLMSNVLPVASNGAPGTIIGDTIYIFGAGAGSNEILSANVSAPTSFTSVGTLPSGNTYMTLAVTPTALFLYGGYFGGIENSLVFTASIGSPLSWTNPASSGILNNLGKFTHVSGGYVYLFGGKLIAGAPSDGVYRSPIADGLNFTLVYNNSRGKALATTQTIDGRLYVYGGNYSVAPIYEVAVSDLDALVSTPFITTSRTLPLSQWGYMGIGIDNNYYMYGGANSFSTIVNTISHCTIHTPTSVSRGPANFDTTIGGTVFPASIVGGYTVRIDDTIYFFGGVVSGFNTKIWSAPASNPTNITEIASSGGPSSAHGKAFIVNGYIYVLGGDDDNNTILTSVFKAPITDPTKWVTSPATIPTSRTRYNLAVIGNYVYTFGGGTSIVAGVTGVSNTTVYRIDINELDQSGATGWVTATALATATQDAVMTICNGYLYLIGGTSTGYTSIGTVQCCSIEELANGISNFRNLGNFCPGATNISSSQALYSNGDFYLLGGRIGNTSGGTTVLHRSSSRDYMKSINDIVESTESVPLIDLGTGIFNTYNSFMQTGNFPWIIAKTT